MLTVLACIFVPLGVIWLLVVSPSFRTAAVIFVALILITIRGIWNWFRYNQDRYGESAQQTNQVIEDNNRHQKETATIDEWCRANVAGVDIEHWKSVIIPDPTNDRHSVICRVAGGWVKSDDAPTYASPDDRLRVIWFDQLRRIDQKRCPIV
jgi:hypothetical protein